MRSGSNPRIMVGIFSTKILIALKAQRRQESDKEILGKLIKMHYM